MSMLNNQPPKKPSMTQQHMNNQITAKDIMKRVVRPASNGQPFFGDFSDVGGLLEYENTMVSLRREFSRLPVATRDKFDYDPLKMLEFLQKEENTIECGDLGLIDKKSERYLKAVEGRRLARVQAARDLIAEEDKNKPVEKPAQ